MGKYKFTLQFFNHQVFLEQIMQKANKELLTNQRRAFKLLNQPVRKLQFQMDVLYNFKKFKTS